MRRTKGGVQEDIWELRTDFELRSFLYKTGMYQKLTLGMDPHCLSGAPISLPGWEEVGDNDLKEDV